MVKFVAPKCRAGRRWVARGEYSRGGEGSVRRDSPQFHDAMPNVAVLRYVGRRHRLSRGHHHLVERTAGGEVWVKLLAEFARPAGARIKSFYDGCINVFHTGSSGRNSLGRSSSARPKVLGAHCDLGFYCNSTPVVENDVLLQGTHPHKPPPNSLCSGRQFFACNSHNVNN